jgi:hypothetical protein
MSGDAEQLLAKVLRQKADVEPRGDGQLSFRNLSIVAFNKVIGTGFLKVVDHSYL